MRTLRTAGGQILAKWDLTDFETGVTERCAMNNCNAILSDASAIRYSCWLLRTPQILTPEAARQQQTNGWLAYDREDFSRALLSFERATNLNPDLADAHNGLGWSHLSVSRVSAVNPQIVAKAKQAFEDAIRIDPSNADAWVGLANTLFLRRESDSDFQAALLALENAFDANHQFLFRHDYRSAGRSSGAESGLLLLSRQN